MYMGNNNRYSEITSETKGKAVSNIGLGGVDFLWTEGETGQKFRYKPFSLTCKEPMELKVIYWGDLPGDESEPNLSDNTNAIIVHFTEGSNSHRLFKIVAGVENSNSGGLLGEIVANR